LRKYCSAIIVFCISSAARSPDDTKFLWKTQAVPGNCDPVWQNRPEIFLGPFILLPRLSGLIDDTPWRFIVGINPDTWFSKP